MATARRTPKRVIADIVIDIDSSPDPEPRECTRSSSRTRAASLQGNTKGKGKGNSQSNNVVGKRLLGPVIELTDSESETGSVVQTNRSPKNCRQTQAQARPKPFPMMHADSLDTTLLTTVPARASLENIPFASSSTSLQRKVRDTAPLFLPVQSDEDKELDLVPGPSRKRSFQGQETNSLPDENDLDQERLRLPHERHENVPTRSPVRDPPPVLEVQQPEVQIRVAPSTSQDDMQDVNFVEVGPEPERDLASEAVARVLEVIPDVEPDYVLGLVITHLPDFATQTAEHVLGLLFEDGGYPKIDKKGKRKATESANENGDVPPNKRPKIDYAVVDRPFTGSPMYGELALVQLQISFPLIPKAYLRRCLQENRCFYAPTHLAIAAIENRCHGVRPYAMKATRYNSKKDLRKYAAVVDEAFAQERHWLVDHLQDPKESTAETVGAPIAGLEIEIEGKGKGRATEPEEEPIEDGTGVECQCCFTEYAFDKMVQCPETHLFCSSCISQYAATKLGEHNSSIVCMHSSGCAQPFPTSELRRVLSSKLMKLYERVKQQKEIQEASIEGLEECPFCEWKCVIETPVEQEKLFRCGNEEGGCGEVSCRLCKKKDHLPKSCQEVEQDKLLEGRHAIEEAMTRALMRNCPKCQKAFVKEAGCNKMTCPNCRTLSCYVCRKVISGYDHFNQAPPGLASTSRSGGNCLLWDNVDERHAAEVEAAAEKAAADYKRDHPDVDDKDIKVDIPTVPKPPQILQQDPRLNRPMLQPGPHLQWHQARVPVNLEIPNHNPFLPLVQIAGRQRRYPIRGQHQPQNLQVGMEPRHIEQQRALEEQRIDLQARPYLVQEQERQRLEVLGLENQRYYNQVYEQQRAQLERELRDQREARGIRLDARIGLVGDDHFQQYAPQLGLGAEQGRAQAHVLAPGQPQRGVGPDVPARPVRGAAGVRRTQRG